MTTEEQRLPTMISNTFVSFTFNVTAFPITIQNARFEILKK